LKKGRDFGVSWGFFNDVFNLIARHVKLPGDALQAALRERVVDYYLRWSAF
jgi:hypothetical protein